MHGECYNFEHQPLKHFFLNQKLAFTQLAVETKTPLYIFHHRNRTPTDLTPQQAGLRKRQAYRRPAAAKKKKNWLSGGRGQN